MVLSLAAELAGELLSADEKLLLQRIAAVGPTADCYGMAHRSARPLAAPLSAAVRPVHHSPAVHDRRPGGCFGSLFDVKDG